MSKNGDAVNRPAHYTFATIEPIDVIEAWALDFHLGQVVKYVARAGRKGVAVQDLRKARWYLTRKIRRLLRAATRAAGATVILGQAPSSTSEPDRPLRGRPLAVMAAAADLSPKDMGAAFELRNVLQEYPGKGPRGDAFPRPQAAAAVQALLPELEGRRVILLGTRVAELFGLRGQAARMEWTEHRGMTVAVVPHPSGLSRWWNDPANRAEAGAFLRAEYGRSRHG